MNYFAIVAIVLFLDGLIGAVGFSVLTMGASAEGAASVVALIPGLGQLAAAAGTAVNAALTVIGAAISSVLGLMGLAITLTMLSMSDLITGRQLLSWRRGPLFVIKFIPILNMLPSLTMLTVTSILRKQEAEKKAAALLRLSRAAAGPAKGGDVGALAAGEGSVGQPAATRTGSSAANDNQQQAAANGNRPQPASQAQSRVPLPTIQYGGASVAAARTAAALALALGLWFSPASAVHAQALGSEPVPVQYIVSPETPGAHQSVYIEVNGVGNFIGNSPIIWTKDGSVVSQGTGLRTFSFTTGGFGVPTVISVSIQTDQYGTITHSWTFSPSLLNLAWEAHTTVPPFYDGKALASPGSSVTVTAFPVIVAQGVRQSAQNLSFQWKLNGTLQTDRSGLGHRAYTFTIDQIHANEEISVDVLLSDGNTKVAHGDIVVPATDPMLVLYPHDPLRGMLYQSALPAVFTMPGTEITVRAEPFFFSTDSLARGALQYGWQINGADTTGPQSAQGELTLRQTGSGQGAASLFVSLQNLDRSKILQAAQLSSTVSYGTVARGSLFGI